VGFAVGCGMKEYQEILDYQKLVELSVRFVYSECKKIDGIPESEGTTLRCAMKVLKNKGICREKFWPYKPQVKGKAQKGAASDAKKFRVLTYARILNLNELRMNLASKGPCVAGIEVFRGIMETKSGIIPMPKNNEPALGGHAVCIVGYDDKNKLVKFKNSWSKNWGDSGYGYLPYVYLEKYMMDAWSSLDIDDPNPFTLASVLSYKQRVLV
jgi:C1A family cysteine protease